MFVNGNIIYTFHNYIFFKTTDLYTLDTKINKKYFKLMKANIKKMIGIHLQITKYIINIG